MKLLEIWLIYLNVDENGTETYENCPVIRLGDTAFDLKTFPESSLCTLVRPYSSVSWYLHMTFSTSRCFRFEKKTKFPIVAAVLRLSTKYDAPLLRRRAIDLVSTTHPSTLAAWDNRSKTRLVPPFEGEIGALLTIGH